MTKTTAKKEASTDVMQLNVWKHIGKILDTQGSLAAITELEKITGESDKLFLTNQIFINCL